ncbi:peptidylprolyl isomerase [Pediococcus pentosaceus]|uniref:peptidylprolyl isomerase PrsA n=1 Tax=Pediococcus pentosaceus TaxID=1255 RepID=UPI00190ADE41|nr:peptidylprolyl isomerase PrsA [Pediococcus pentosaceus]MBF7125752.1 peptidylprolyl isomerase [Pediococcus pentosaceus]WPK17196.1 peptidylprolyl isomerase PrsA [Pediococcus pentosaceus]
MKKVLIGFASIAMAFTLAACGNKTVATTSGGKITQDEYYSSLKNTTSGKQVLQEMIVNKVLEKQYGDKVSKKTVTKQYNSYKDQYGMTTSSLKTQIRSNLLLKEAVKANDKISNAELKKEWKSYEPKVTVAQILVSKKSTAEDVIKKLNDGGDFTKLAKKYSTDSSTKNKGGKIAAFDDTNSTLDSSFKKAAFKLDEGKYTTTPVKTEYGYQVIKMINKPSKGKMSDHTKELKERIWNADMSDSTTLRSVITKVLKKGNVTIKDKDLKNVLDDYLGSSASSSTK